MPDYAVFGGFLRSDLPFPSLPELRGRQLAPTWVLRRGPVPRHRTAEHLLGEDVIGDGSPVRLYQDDAGYRIVYDAVGAFGISIDGCGITWDAEPKVDPELVRLSVIGRVFSTVHHLTGAICLHGSAVAVGDAGITFLAPPRFGKSTLAQALVEAGARLAGDDNIPVVPGKPPSMRPGVHAVRLWRDSVAVFAGTGDSADGIVFEKHALHDHHPAQRLMEPVPLRAIYLLVPVKPGAGPVVQREAIAATQATISLVGHARSGALLARLEAPVLLDRAAAVASAVPVYRLALVRHLDRLAEAVAGILEWHGLSRQSGSTGENA